jgi:LDH2 family malate/lactate/ureidoglycolate dehydrogenase
MSEVKYIFKDPDFLEFCYFRAWSTAGASEEHAKIMARCIAYGDRIGKQQQGMGVFEAPITVLRSGNLDIKAIPEVVLDGPAYTVIDGNMSSGQYTLTKATSIAIEKARSSGISISLSRNHNDAGCFAAYTSLAADQDMIAIATNNALRLVSPWGAMENILCSLPLAMSSPGGDEAPIEVDIATGDTYDAHISEAYFNKTKLKGKWLADPETGELTDDVTNFYTPIDEFGRLADCSAPVVFDSPRLYALSVMCEVLSGVLVPGGRIGPEIPYPVSAWTKYQGETSVGGSMIIVINPAIFGDIKEFKSKSDKLARYCKDAKKLPDVDEIFLPGERGYRNRVTGLEVKIQRSHWDGFKEILNSFNLSIKQLQNEWQDEINNITTKA